MNYIKDEFQAIGYILLGLFLLFCGTVMFDAWRGLINRLWGSKDD